MFVFGAFLRIIIHQNQNVEWLNLVFHYNNTFSFRVYGSYIVLIISMIWFPLLTTKRSRLRTACILDNKCPNLGYKKMFYSYEQIDSLKNQNQLVTGILNNTCLGRLNYNNCIRKLFFMTNMNMWYVLQC